MRAFKQLDDWPPGHSAAAVVFGHERRLSGDSTRVFHLASVTKPLFAYAILVAIEELTLDLNQVVYEPDVTVAHLLSHSSGLAPEEPSDSRHASVSSVGQRRIYSNYGFELLGRALESSAAMSAAEYLNEAVAIPLGMSNTVLSGSPARDAYSTVDDLTRFAAELLRPSLLSASTVQKATTAFLPDLPGVLPGYGRQEPNPWGLGFEIRGTKSPHWTGTSNSAATYGHFGRSGTFLWVDPELDAACVALTDQDFGPWAATAWPPFSDAVVAELRPASCA